MPRETAERSAEGWRQIGVRFLGRVPFTEIPAHLATAAVGWLPLDPANENYLRAWPIKLTEYMMAGLPIVAARLPIPERVLTEERCGLVVDPLSPTAHASAIVELLSDPVRARSMGEAGRNAALLRYTWVSEAKRLHTLYTELAPPC